MTDTWGFCLYFLCNFHSTTKKSIDVSSDMRIHKNFTWDEKKISGGKYWKHKHTHTHTHAGHCWRSRDELISDVLLWTPTHGRAKAGRPARTYIQQLCEDTGCCPEDLPRAMNDREEWRERVRDIRATSAIWWWWYIYIYIYIYI